MSSWWSPIVTGFRGPMPEDTNSYFGQYLNHNSMSKMVMRRLTDVFMLVSVVMYLISAFSCWSPLSLSDMVKHFTRVAFVFQFIRLLLVLYVLLRQLLPMQMTFVDELLSRENKMAGSEWSHVDLDDGASPLDDLTKMFRFNSLHAQTIHIVFGLGILALNVLSAFLAEQIISAAYANVKARFREWKFGRNRGERLEGGILTRSRSRLLIKSGRLTPSLHSASGWGPRGSFSEREL